MLFFIISLVLGILGTAALFYAFSRSLDRNNGRRNKRPVSYLAPVFLSLFLIYFSIEYTAPRLFDIVALISGRYEVQEIMMSESQIHWSAIVIDDQSYYYNRFQIKPKPAARYTMTALPNSHHVVKLEPIAQSIENGGTHEP